MNGGRRCCDHEQSVWLGERGLVSTSLRRPWPLWLSLGLLLMAGGLAVARALGEGPLHLQTGVQVRTVYAATLAYAYGALPATAIALVALILLGLAWLRARANNTAARSAVGVALVAVAWVVWTALPRAFVGYQHLLSVTHADDDYRLGVRTALDGDDFFVVSRCPRGQTFCEAHGIAAVQAAERGSWSQIRLLPGNATSALAIHTPTRVIPVRVDGPAGSALR